MRIRIQLFISTHPDIHVSHQLNSTRIVYSILNVSAQHVITTDVNLFPVRLFPVRLIVGTTLDASDNIYSNSLIDRNPTSRDGHVGHLDDVIMAAAKLSLTLVRVDKPRSDSARPSVCPRGRIRDTEADIRRTDSSD